MGRHIFLTGEIQVGKSTVAAKVLGQLGIVPRGFRTYFGIERWSPNRRLYLNSALEEKSFAEEKVIAAFREGGSPEVFISRFDDYGSRLLRDARKDKCTRIILMDECGSLEKNALAFQEEVLKTLDENTPVLGVIKEASTGWTDKIRNHPQVKLLTVTRENRDSLPRQLFQHYLHLT